MDAALQSALQARRHLSRVVQLRAQLQEQLDAKLPPTDAAATQSLDMLQQQLLPQLQSVIADAQGTQDEGGGGCGRQEGGV